MVVLMPPERRDPLQGEGKLLKMMTMKVTRSQSGVGLGRGRGRGRGKGRGRGSRASEREIVHFKKCEEDPDISPQHMLNPNLERAEDGIQAKESKTNIVQKKLQMRIEAQGKYLEAILEKGQKSLV